MLRTMDLAGNLKKLMLKHSLGISKLSKATGIPLTTLANWLNGQPPKNIIQVKTVANHFSISIDELVFRAGPKPHVHDLINDESHVGIYEVVLRKIRK